MLVAFTYKGTGAPEIRNRAQQVESYRNNTRRKRDAAMIRSIFTRDGHACDLRHGGAGGIVAAELKFGDQVPTGTYLDMAANLPLVDPMKVLSPVLMMRGVYDGNSTNEDLLDFYRQLPNGDRQFVILPHTAHSPGYSNNRHLLWYATRNFLAAPAACCRLTQVEVGYAVRSVHRRIDAASVHRCRARCLQIAGCGKTRAARVGLLRRLFGQIVAARQRFGAADIVGIARPDSRRACDAPDRAGRSP